MGLPTLGALERQTDPEVNPAGAQAAANAFMGKGDRNAPPPLPPEPEDDILELPGGYLDRQGTLHTRCRVRDLNGEDEEELARPAARRSPVHLVDTLVHRCVVEIGPYKVGPDLPKTELDNMLVGDRDMVALAVRKLTYGNKIPLDATCPACRNEFQVEYDLDADVPIKKLDGDPAKQQRTVAISNPVQGDGDAVVRLVTGAMQKAVMDADPRNELSNQELTTLLLREAVDFFRGSPVNGVKDVLRWKAKDRQTIRRYLDDTTCGPRYEEVSQDCPKCRHAFPLWIDLGVLFP